MLAVDTTDRVCSVACRFDNITSVLYSDEGVKNTDVILHMILEVCKKTGINLSKIENIIVTIGPGSFTGVRVGVMIAKIIAHTNSAQLLPITSSLAQVLPMFKTNGAGTYASLIDARMQECYFSAFEIDECGYKELEANQVLPVDLASRNSEKYQYQQSNFDSCKICPENMLDYFQFLTPVENEKLLPLYLRNPV